MIVIAELKQTKQTKTVSLDNVYSALFATDNPMLLDLGKLPPNTRFKLTIELDESTPHAPSDEEETLSFD